MVEDCFNQREQNGLFAVFDGHSGDRAADFCESNFLQALIKCANDLERGDTSKTIKQGK